MVYRTPSAVRVERRGAIAVLTVDRPHARNALDLATIREFDETIATIEDDEAILAVVLTGAGESVFIAGGDLKDFQKGHLPRAGDGLRRRHRGRILIAKPGLDGHDRGAKIIVSALRDAGFEVVYTGLRQRPEHIVAAAVQEDVDLIGLSILSGAHIELTRRVVGLLAEAGARRIEVVVGGTIPDEDVPVLQSLGVAGVFPTGASLGDVVAAVRRILAGAPRQPH